jgi:hypothetical protein
MLDLRRRELIALLGGAAAAWPLSVRAAGKQPRVAVLTLVSAADEIGRIAAFVAGMRDTLRGRPQSSTIVMPMASPSASGLLLMNS